MRKRVIERHRREDLERRFNENPASIDKTWASFFTSLGKREGLSRDILPAHHGDFDWALSPITLHSFIYRPWRAWGSHRGGVRRL